MEQLLFTLSSGEGPRSGGEVTPRSATEYRKTNRLVLMSHSKALTYLRAKQMRQSMTQAEARLWEALRAGRLNGIKFYRQVPIGQYIVDFAFHRLGQIVEVDGATHGEPHEIEHDAQRTRFLQERGYRILRFNNEDVFVNLPGVLDSILLEAERCK